MRGGITMDITSGTPPTIGATEADRRARNSADTSTLPAIDVPM